MILDFLTEAIREPAECIILVGSDDVEIVDLYPFLMEVTIERCRTKPAEATLVFETRRDETGKWTVQDSDYLVPWEPIIIKAGFGTHEEEIMRGFIRDIKTECPEDAGETKVTVNCQDESFQMDREHIRDVWGKDTPTTDAAIIDEILGKYKKLSKHPDSGEGQSELEVNQDGTDICFLQKRAEANGYDLIVRDGTVYFGEMRTDGDAQANILVYAGSATNCYNISINDDGHKPEKVAYDRPETDGTGNVPEAVEPDLKSLGQEKAVSANTDLENFTWRMSQQGGMSDEEWAARAQKKANELSMRITAEGELDGSFYGHVLREGEPVGVDGVGERHNGIYFVDSVQHTFNFDGYRQSFKLLRNAYGDNLENGSSSVLSGVI
jgi:phage protein D